jgi:hypothetical protein
VALAVALMPAALGSQPVDHGPALAWWQLAGVFSLAAFFVVHIEINSEAHSFSFSEVPLVLGLLFAQPGELIVARLVGEAVALVLIQRQSPPKLAFNLSLFAAESTCALALFQVIADRPDPLAARTWLAAGLGVMTAAVLGALTVWLVIRLHGGRASSQQLLVAGGGPRSGTPASPPSPPC